MQMGRWLRSVAQFSLFLALTGLLLPAEETGRPRISLEEARRLVYMLVKEHNRDAEVSRIKDPYDADFYYFEVIVSNPVASPVIGHYAVNPWTADVWNPASCELVTLPSIDHETARKTA
jgi:hypothetical protein